MGIASLRRFILPPGGQVKAPESAAPLYSDTPHPTRPKVPSASQYRLHSVLEKNFLWYAVSSAIQSNAITYKAFTWTERKVKNNLFGCRMCGQCALPATGYACPMTCPKQLRNGPCGGVSPDGSCEVYPGLRCVWLQAYERAESEGHANDLRKLQRPIDQRKWGQSSWVNYWQGEDDDLWTPTDSLQSPPELLVGSDKQKGEA